MTARQSERRRSARVPLQDHSIGLRIGARVKVLDISSSGALLSGAMLEPGIRAALTIPLTSGSLACEVEVRQRETLVSDSGLEVRVGVSFENMSPAGRDALTQLLASARH